MDAAQGGNRPSRKTIGIVAGAGVIAAAVVGGGIWWAVSSSGEAPLGSPSAVSAGERLASELAGGDEAVAERQTVAGEGLFQYAFEADDLVETSGAHAVIADQLIVTTEGEAGLDEVKRAAEQIDARVVGVNDYLGSYQLLLADALDADGLAQLGEEVAGETGIASAVPNEATSRSYDSTEWDGDWGADLGPADVGNWGMQALGAPVIWDYAAAEPGDFTPAAVGVVDAFYKDVWHKDLQDGTQSMIPWWGSDDEAGHGLHVSGTITTRTDVDDTGVRGVAPYAELVVASSNQVRGDAHWWWDDYSEDETLTFVVESGAKVVNMSFGALNADEGRAAQNGDDGARDEMTRWGEKRAKTLNELLEDHDFLVVKASGNESCTADQVASGRLGCASVGALDATLGLTGAAEGTPLESHLLTVAAEVDRDNGLGYEVAWFSNSGADIAAPGVDILSAWTDDGYKLDTGTSMAAPHISGLATALFSTAPDLTAEEVRDLILGTANHAAPLRWNGQDDELTQAPMANGAAAFQAALLAAGLEGDERRAFFDDVASGAVEATGLPAAMLGTYCSGEGCFDLNAYLEGAGATVQVAADDPTGASAVTSTLTICEDADCAASDAVRLRYFPPGAVSDAASDDAAHDVGYPRIAQVTWDESGAPVLGEPYRLAPDAEGAAELPFEGSARPVLTEASVAGTWRLVSPPPEYGRSDGGFVAADGSFTYDSGRVDDYSATPMDDGTLSLIGIGPGYSSCSDAISVCFPLGLFVPAGTSAQIADFYQLEDRPDVDRVWNGQTGELFVRVAERTPAEFPRYLQGEWCSRDDADDCFNLSDFLAKYPGGFVGGSGEDSQVSGARVITLCLFNDLGDGCTTSASMSFRYFPAGVEWNCTTVDDGKPMFGFDTCDPDYTDAHETSEPRLVPLLSHQHGEQYVDSEPLYREE